MLRAFFRNIFRNKRAEQELDDEVRSYLELTAAENVRRGMSSEEALQKARRDLGGMEQVKENVRDVRTGASFETLMQDVRYAIRSLRKNPSFATIAILTLALGIGANTTIFSVVNGVLLKPLPYPHPDRLVTLWESHPEFGRFLTVAPANFYDWRAQSSSFERMAALDPYPDFILTGGSQPYRLTGAAVTADFFPLFQVHLALGRVFQATEDHVVVLSYSTWQQYFNGRPDIAGSQVRLNDESYTVVGVLPRDFYLVSKASDFQARRHFDVWTNLGLTVPPEAWQRETHPLFAFGRLKSGVPLRQAQADLARIAINLARLYRAADQDHTIDVVPMTDNAVGGVRTALFTLLGGVGIVLLIACANIANLLLTRAAARQKEMALRAALGASRTRLARQLLTESGVLAAIGSAIGFALTLWAVPSLAAHLPADLPRVSEIAVDGRVLAFTCLIAIATGILFGLVPLVSSRGVRLTARGVASGQSRMRNALIVGQVSLALVLLAGAGLMTKSLRALLQVSPGFQTAHILTARLSLPPRYANVWKFGIGLRRELSAFQRALSDSVRAIPGVQSAAFASYLPLTGTDSNWAFFIEGRPPKPPGVYDSADYRPVTAGYFETMGIPVMRGRPFTARDDEDHPLVIIISESMARQFWPGEDPLGKRLRFGGNDWRTIVGIVRRRPSSRARVRAAGGHVRPLGTGSQRRDPPHHRSALVHRTGESYQRFAKSCRRGRSRSADGPDRHHGTACIRLGGGIALPHRRHLVIRAAGAVRRLHRPVWRDELPREPADEGIRHSNRGGSEPRLRIPPGPWTRRQTRGHRSLHRIGGSGAPRPIDFEPALRRHAARRSHLGERLHPPRGRSPSRQLHPRAPRRQCRSDGLSAV